MTTAKNLALAVSLASYAKDHSAPAVVTISTQKLVKVERAKPIKGRAAKMVQAAEPTIEPTAKPVAPSPNAAMATVKLPAAGTLGAKGFIMMMNRAKSRDEKISAIAAFIGYDVGGDFATQEMGATAKAKAEVCPVKVTAPTPSASRSVAGYVAGIPDMQRRVILDLLGRETLAVDTRNAMVRDARNKALNWTERKLAIGLARLEQERLASIRADLARYV